MQLRFRMGVAGLMVAMIAACLRAAGPATAAQVAVVTDRPQAIYTIGQRARFLISVKGVSLPATGAQVSYILDKDGMPPVTKGTATLQQGQATVEGTLNEPGFLRCRVTYAAVAGQPPLTATASAGFDPLKIAPSLPVPDDFDAFWARQKARLAAVPMTPTLKPVRRARRGWKVLTCRSPASRRGPCPGIFPVPRVRRQKACRPCCRCMRRAC